MNLIGDVILVTKTLSDLPVKRDNWNLVPSESTNIFQSNLFLSWLNAAFSLTVIGRVIRGVRGGGGGGGGGDLIIIREGKVFGREESESQWLHQREYFSPRSVDIYNLHKLIIYSHENYILQYLSFLIARFKDSSFFLLIYGQNAKYTDRY